MQDLSSRQYSDKGQRRLTDILDVAGILIAEHGLETFSVNKVAAEAGISLGNLQYYFPRKKDLFFAMLKRQLFPAEEMMIRAKSANGGSECNKQLLRDILALAMNMNARDDNCAVVWHWVTLSLYDDEAKAILDEWYPAYKQLVASAVACYNPALSKSRVDFLAVFITAALEGHALIWRSISKPNKLQRLQRNFISSIEKLVED